MARGDSYQLQGQQGGVVLTSSSSADDGEGPFRWIQVINDAQFNDIASQKISGVSALSGLTIPAGVGFGGVFSDVELVSGVVIAYSE